MDDELSVFAIFLLLAAPGFAAAQDTAEEESGPWSGNVSLGYLESSGNTNNSSTSAEFAVNYVTGAWNHGLTGKAYTAIDDEVTTAEAYSAGWKSTWNFTDVDYLFGALDWNRDRFSGYDQQLFATIGYGKKLLDSKKFKLNLEIGAGYSQQDLVGGSSQDNVTARASGNFKWKLSDNADFEQSLASFFTSDNTFIESVSKITAGLIGNIGLTFSYTIKRNSDVPPGTTGTDRLTSLSLRYEF